MAIHEYRITRMVSVGAVALFTACSEISTADTPFNDGSNAARLLAVGHSRGIEDEFLRIEATLPGFGGYYSTNSGDVEAFVTDLRSRDRAVSEIRRSLARASESSKPDGGTVQIRLIEGEFPFSDLVRWQLALRRSPLAGQVISLLDADERLTVFV